MEGTHLLEIHSKSEGNSMVESQLIQTGGIEILVSRESAAVENSPAASRRGDPQLTY